MAVIPRDAGLFVVLKSNLLISEILPILRLSRPNMAPLGIRIFLPYFIANARHFVTEYRVRKSTNTHDYQIFFLG